MGIITNKLNEFQTNENLRQLTDKFNEELGSKGDCKVYPNQVQCGIDALKSFDSNFPRPNHIIIQGKTQAGKTGVLACIIMLIKRFMLNKSMSVERIIYITGDNGCKLLEQTKKRISECTKNISCGFEFMKNSDMKKQISNHSTLKNAIIFIDESHYGVNDDKNVLIKWLTANGIDMHNSKDLIEKYVYIVSNSATPFGEIVSDNAQAKSIVYLHTDDWNGESGYVGFEEMYKSNIIQGVKHNINKNNVENECELIKEKLIAQYNATGIKKSVIIRMNKKTYCDCKDILERYFDVETYFAKNEKINYAAIHSEIEHFNDGDDSIEDWKPLCIIVAGAYRMGVSIPEWCKKKIGVVYDYCGGKTKVGAAVTTEQGLFGRMTGYWFNNEWQNMTVFINEEHVKALKSCYVEETSRTTQVDFKEDFIACDDGDVVDVVSESSIEEFQLELEYQLILNDAKEYNKIIQNFLENWKEKFKDMIFIPGRRNSDTQKIKFDKPMFSKNMHGMEKYLIPENNGRGCYTTLYDTNSGIISVRFGTIRKGKMIQIVNDSTKVISTLATAC